MPEESDDPDDGTDGESEVDEPRDDGDPDAASDADSDGSDSDGSDSGGAVPDEEPPLCRHGMPRRWLEKPEPYGWRGWFCAADVPPNELCLPVFVGRAHQYDRRHRLRWRGRRGR